MENEITSIDDIREKLAVEVPQPEPEVKSEPEKVEEPAVEEKPAEVVEEKAELTEEEKLADEEAAKKASAVQDEALKEAGFKVEESVFKFKVGGKEYEIPEKFRAIATDEESLKELKDVFEKAYGLDYAKPYHQKTREKLESYEKEVIPAFKEQNQIIDELAGYVKRKDYDSYFERLGIPEKDVQAWMLTKLNLTPEQKFLYNQNRELQKQLYQRETENQSLSQTAEAAKRETQTEQERQILNELDFTLGKGEYKDRVSAYESQHGQGSFKDKVIQVAAFIEQTEKKSLSIEEATKRTLEFIPPAIANTVAPNKQVGGVAFPKEKPVLPQIAAKAQSPAAKQVTSIKEIRERAAKMGAFQE